MRLELLRRQYPDDTDYWNGNWIVTRVYAVAPGFQADFVATVHLREIISLREEVAQMIAVLEGRIEWKAMEGFLEFRSERNKLGHIRWTIDILYPAGTGNKLSLQLDNDQTYLPEILNQLDDILEAFPLVGSPIVP